MPGSAEWLKTFSFGDLIKIAAFLGAGLITFTNLKSDLLHEAEMRQMLEARTQEMVSEMRQAQKDNSSRTDQRFQENATRDRELLGEVKARMDRLEGKVDQLLAGAQARGERR